MTVRRISAFAIGVVAVVLVLMAAALMAPQGRASKLTVEIDRAKEVQHAAKALDSPDAAVRLEAARALQKNADLAESAIPRLVDALADEDEAVGRQAANALGEIGEASIVPIMQSVDRLERRHLHLAMQALTRSGPAALPSIINLLKSNNVEHRIAAAQATGEVASIFSPALSSLVEQIRDADVTSRTAAERMLIDRTVELRLGPRAAEALPELTKLMDDENAQVREAAIRSILQISQHSAESFELVISKLDDPAPKVRYAIVQHLVFADDHEDIDRAYVKSLRDIYAPARYAALRGIRRRLKGWKRGNPAIWIPGVKKLALEEVSSIRILAIRTIGDTPAATSQIASDSLIEFLKDEDADIRIEAAASLTKLGKFKGPVADVLVAELENPDSETRWAALKGLASAGPAATPAIPAIIKMVASQPQPDQAWMAALRVLHKLGQSVIPIFAIQLRHQNPKVRVAAVEGIGLMRDTAQSLVPALTELLKDPNADVRLATAGALAAIGPAAIGAESALQSVVLDDVDQHVRMRANFALSAILPEAEAGGANDLLEE